MPSLRIALAQINPTIGALEENRAKIIAWIQQATASGADIIVFPELALTGYPPEDLLFKKSFLAAIHTQMQLIAPAVNDAVVIVGFADSVGDDVYNAAGIFHNRKLESVYHKVKLPNYGVFDEKRYFRAGGVFSVVDMSGTTFGVSICEDIWQADNVPYVQSLLGEATLLINLSASPYHSGKLSARESVLAERAQQAKAWICYVNLVGGQDELVFDGASLIVDPEGRVVSRGKQFEEDCLIYDIDCTALKKAREEDEAFSEQRTQLFQAGIPLEQVTIDHELCLKKPLPGRTELSAMDAVEEIYNALVLGTRDYIQKNGFDKVVIGLSGGIDSALTCLIACDAVGAENTIAVSMPSVHSSAETRADARLMAENLGITHKVIPINAMVDGAISGLGEVFSGLSQDTTEENIQARMRGTILMALSNKFGWLVLATGNKSELSVGYCTLYGDMVGGFAVIKDVPKDLVYRLSLWRNQQAEKPLIPEGIITRPPSAELRPDQKDSDDLPPYDELDPILQNYVEEERPFNEIVADGHDPATVRRVMRMVDANEYKRRQSPPGIKITPKAFGKDRRLPITNHFREE